MDSGEPHTCVHTEKHTHAHMHAQMLERTGQNDRSGCLSAYFDAIHCYFHAWLAALRWLHKITHLNRTSWVAREEAGWFLKSRYVAFSSKVYVIYKNDWTIQKSVGNMRHLKNV